jgi:hypothetical protein
MNLDDDDANDALRTHSPVPTAELKLTVTVKKVKKIGGAGNSKIKTKLVHNTNRTLLEQSVQVTLTFADRGISQSHVVTVIAGGENFIFASAAASADASPNVYVVPQFMVDTETKTLVARIHSQLRKGDRQQLERNWRSLTETSFTAVQVEVAPNSQESVEAWVCGEQEIVGLVCNTDLKEFMIRHLSICSDLKQGRWFLLKRELLDVGPDGARAVFPPLSEITVLDGLGNPSNPTSHTMLSESLFGNARVPVHFLRGNITKTVLGVRSFVAQLSSMVNASADQASLDLLRAVVGSTSSDVVTGKWFPCHSAQGIPQVKHSGPLYMCCCHLQSVACAEDDWLAKEIQFDSKCRYLLAKKREKAPKAAKKGTRKTPAEPALLGSFALRVVKPPPSPARYKGLSKRAPKKRKAAAKSPSTSKAHKKKSKV